MQPSDNVAVNLAELTTHATHLDSIAAQVDVSTEAARYVQMNVEAYGKVCAFVPTYLNHLSEPLADGLRTIVESLRDTATRLRSTAAAYSTADDGAVDRLQNLHP